MGLLDGQVVVVTGAAQGIGFAIASVCAESGATVVLGDRDGPAVEAAAQRIGPAATGIQCDVAELEQVEHLMSVAALGDFAVLVNNAGVTRDAKLSRMTPDQFDDVIRVNLRGCWNGIKAAAPLLRTRSAGSIVNISSISGKTGIIGQTNYSAAKAGIVGLTKAAARELAPYNVRVNTVQPGLIRTAMTEAMPAAAWEQKMSEIPLGRAGEPEEVATCALFLASDMSSYVTGAVLEIAGGRFM